MTRRSATRQTVPRDHLRRIPGHRDAESEVHVPILGRRHAATGVKNMVAIIQAEECSSQWRILAIAEETLE